LLAPDLDPCAHFHDNAKFLKEKILFGAFIMYAVIFTGGKQYRVQEGETLKVETLSVDAGQQIEFDKVLLIQSDAGLKVGQPFLADGKVTATVMAHGRHKKIHIIKFRRRKHHMKRQGHRQNYTEVRITGISG
jgi:large subunit ribosomal protein L21